MENKNKKERLFYLDLIRVISIAIVVTYHFAVHFSETHLSMKILSDGRWGLFAVTLFFAISGASLMYNYEGKMSLKTYYKKRFLGIYPAFWISYSLVFLYYFWKNKGFFVGLPIYKLIFSFLGIDGYLSAYIGTFYLIGEWFLSVIILIYVIFPLLQIGIRKFPKILIALMTVIYLLILFKFNAKRPLGQNIIVSIYSFLIGMYFMKYINIIKNWQAISALIVSLIILRFGTLIPTAWYQVLTVNIMAYLFLFVFGYLGQKMNVCFIKNIINKISKYSYIIFLLQHCVILDVNSYFLSSPLDKYGMVCVYIICWIIILVLAKYIYKLNKKLINLFSGNEKT